MLKWWADGASNSSGTLRQYVEPRYRRIDNSHHVYAAIFGPVGNASTVRYQVKDHRFSSTAYTISRPGPEELHRVLVISDNQNGPSKFRKVLETVRDHYGKNGKPDAILHVGDSVQNVRSLSDWQKQMFSPMSDMVSYQHTSPLIFVPGNHDHDKRCGADNSNYYADMYHGIWDISGLAQSKNSIDSSYHQFYHSVSVGSARLVILDAECPSKEQYEFLERELQSTVFQNARFRIVAVHIPPFIEFWDPYTWNEKGEKHWGEHVRLEYDHLFRKYGVDLVISGHQHNYQRSTIKRDVNQSTKDTITYAIVGGAGGTLDLERVEDWKMYNVTYLDHHFVSLDITSSKLHWSARNIAGAVIDEFTIER
ncbi:hypothetical protein GGI07_000324 [Coemansia sp. Benny D115]|nr:hypothetical protein GGI07_000324 [Coemansia sp. Benny D115]